MSLLVRGWAHRVAWTRTYTVLGIETSCDDTAAAVVSSSKSVLSHSLASQHKIHSEHGGIVPHLAAREHEKNLPVVVPEAVENSGVRYEDLDAVGVTFGPGMSMCLKKGITFANGIAQKYNKPLYLINHLEAHTNVVRLEHGVAFPFLALIMSGGHTQLVLAKEVGSYALLGSTLDDAVGECFDKVARVIGLPLRGGMGGRSIEVAAARGDPARYPLPIPLKNHKGADFSYSGLKTATVRLAAGLDLTNESTKNDVAASFQYSACAHMVNQTKRALNYCEVAGHNISSLVLCGGVAANSYIRGQFDDMVSKSFRRVPIVAPDPSLCTDNGVMVAWAVLERMGAGVDPGKLHIRSDGYIDIQPRMPMHTEEIILTR